MRYTEAEFFDLMDAIESIGGRYLEDQVHEVTTMDFGHGNPPVKLGCGKPGLFEIPDGERFLTLCARCDDLGAWPRLRGNIQA
jgi:hypothetical protein